MRKHQQKTFAHLENKPLWLMRVWDVWDEKVSFPIFKKTESGQPRKFFSQIHRLGREINGCRFVLHPAKWTNYR